MSGAGLRILCAVLGVAVRDRRLSASASCEVAFVRERSGGIGTPFTRARVRVFGLAYGQTLTLLSGITYPLLLWTVVFLKYWRRSLPLFTMDCTIGTGGIRRF